MPLVTVTMFSASLIFCGTSSRLCFSPYVVQADERVNEPAVLCHNLVNVSDEFARYRLQKPRSGRLSAPPRCRDRGA